MNELPPYKELQQKIIDTMDKYAGDTRKTRSKRIMSVAIDYARDLAARTWQYKQEHPDLKFRQWEQLLEERGLLLPTAHEESVETLLIESLILIDHTILIDSRKLLQSYHSPSGELLQVTNWFNCSVADFNGKIYMAYRMDLKPFATRMRIGLCELDAVTLQPINVSELPLHIQSNYDVGWHVEDPRLFVHNDALHISYTDGYQMGQARINAWSLTAEESFYLRKPMLLRTEKNWVFFSCDGNLYCIYSTSPYKIFKMNQGNHEVVVNEPFKLKWDYGTISGGASPILHDGYYYHFFHSTMAFPHTRLRRQYFVGCYIFESKFPFKPVAITTSPLLAGEYCDPSIERLSNNIYVVFPCGAYIRDGEWNISFGNNDYECRVLKISNDLLKTFMT